jgi:hypothetical protein
MAWIVARTRPRLSLAAGLVAGLGGIGLLAFGSHAAALETPAPIVAIVVHLIAVGTWLAGLLSVAWLAIAGGPAAWSPARIVPRFSALALVSVGLIGLTGVYADWVHTRSLVPLDSQYGSTLVIKSILALGAFGLGGLNFLSGGRADDRRLRPRLALEAGLAVSVLIVTGLVASGSPPAGELPIAIAPARSSVAAAGPAPTLALAPGRPGPTRFVVTFDAAIDDGVELQLQRLDQSGESRLQLAPIPDQPGQFQAGGGLLPADSRWDASVVRRDSSGSEIARTRFSFALDDTGISEGAASPAVDPAVVVAVIALVLAALGLAFALGGGVLPRVDPATSRIGVAGASIAAAVLGVAILLGGPTT